MPILGVASLALVESCSFIRNPQEELALSYANALTNKQTLKALDVTVSPPPLPNGMVDLASTYAYLTSLSSALEGCLVGSVTIQSQIARAFFTEPCGKGGSKGTSQYQGIVFQLTQTHKGGYKVFPFSTNLILA